MYSRGNAQHCLSATNNRDQRFAAEFHYPLTAALCKHMCVDLYYRLCSWQLAGTIVQERVGLLRAHLSAPPHPSTLGMGTFSRAFTVVVAKMDQNSGCFGVGTIPLAAEMGRPDKCDPQRVPALSSKPFHCRLHRR